MSGIEAFGKADRVVINGTEWQPQHTQEGLSAILRFRKFVTSFYVTRIGGKVTVYARIMQHTAASLYMTTHYHRLRRRMSPC